MNASVVDPPEFFRRIYDAASDSSTWRPITAISADRKGKGNRGRPCIAQRRIQDDACALRSKRMRPISPRESIERPIDAARERDHLEQLTHFRLRQQLLHGVGRRQKLHGVRGIDLR